MVSFSWVFNLKLLRLLLTLMYSSSALHAVSPVDLSRIVSKLHQLGPTVTLWPTLEEATRLAPPLVTPRRHTAVSTPSVSFSSSRIVEVVPSHYPRTDLVGQCGKIRVGIVGARHVVFRTHTWAASDGTWEFAEVARLRRVIGESLRCVSFLDYIRLLM